jgi:hypothetical protein
MMRRWARCYPTQISGSLLAVRRHDPRCEPGALAAHAGICAGAGEHTFPYRGNYGARWALWHHPELIGRNNSRRARQEA